MNLNCSAPPRPFLTVVVPSFNEEDMLPVFLKEIVPRLELRVGRAWEIIFIDDGSRDGTLNLIRQAHAHDTRVKGVSLSRNYGHQAALESGLAFAHGEWIAVMDCDLQDPVEVMLDMLDACREGGFDVCYGERKKRDAPLVLRILYRTFYFLMSRFADHDFPVNAGDFCVMSWRCRRILSQLPEGNRFLRGLRSWIGFRQLAFPYERPQRRKGESKYNLRRLTALALQGFIGFSSLPLRFATMIGFSLGFLSLTLIALVTLNRLVPRFSLFNYWIGANPTAATIIIIMLFLFSGLFLCLGVLSEYIRVILIEIKHRPTSIIREVVGGLEPDDLNYPLIISTDYEPDPRSRP